MHVCDVRDPIHTIVILLEQRHRYDAQWIFVLQLDYLANQKQAYGTWSTTNKQYSFVNKPVYAKEPHACNHISFLCHVDGTVYGRDASLVAN